MKYIITESKSEQDWKSGGYAIIGYHKRHNNIFISSELIEKISNI